jgi:hypothetical protein
VNVHNGFCPTVKVETAEGRACLRETLEAASTKSPEEILQGVKVSERIKDVYQKMFHYANAETLLDYADDIADGVDGVWKLKSHPKGRFVTPEEYFDQATSTTRSQLPLKEISPGQFTPDPNKGRFKCIFQTSEVPSDFRVPQAEVHSTTSNPGLKNWLQPITRDNPHLGCGGAVQFIQMNEVHVAVVDLKTDKVVQNKAHLRQLLLSRDSCQIDTSWSDCKVRVKCSTRQMEGNAFVAFNADDIHGHIYDARGRGHPKDSITKQTLAGGKNQFIAYGEPLIDEIEVWDDTARQWIRDVWDNASQSWIRK